MRNFLKGWLKRQYFSYSRADRNAIILLSVILLISIVGRILVEYLPGKEAGDFSDIKKLVKNWEIQKAIGEKEENFLFAFDPNTISEKRFDSLALPDNVKRNVLAYRKAGGRFHSAEDLRKVYGMNDSLFTLIEEFIHFENPDIKSVKSSFSEKTILHPDYFNPNNASAEELTRIGFSSFQARNLVSYREKGGVFRSPDDLLKIYGIDSIFYQSYRDYCRIDVNVKEAPVIATRESVLIELNRADSVDLMKLPGIGPSYARRIIKYRDLLGGFYSTKQVLEVFNFPQETYSNIENMIYTDTLLIKKLRINFMDYSELLRHPYLSKQQVAHLLDRRDKMGPFKEITELENIQDFDAEAVRKLRPYLTCR